LIGILARAACWLQPASTAADATAITTARQDAQRGVMGPQGTLVHLMADGNYSAPVGAATTWGLTVRRELLVMAVINCSCALSSTEHDQLFRTVTTLSAPNSRLAAGMSPPDKAFR
jgi:hypothetical protein